MTNNSRQNPASYTAYPAFVSSDGYLRQSTLADFRKWILTWTYLMDKNANGTYTVSSMANFEDICIIFGYVNQTQETINIPYARFASGAGIVIRDSVNAQSCVINWKSATSIRLSDLTHTNWHVTIYGR